MPITFDEIAKVDNGARFLTADMHVHSFGGSSDVTDSSMTVEAIIDTAVKNGISVISITDHNSDKNVPRAIEYAGKYASQLLFISGSEITTANGHLLVYFALERAASLSKFLAQIDIVGEPGARDSHTSMSMADVISEAQRLGGLCVAAHIDRQKTGFEMVISGYPNAKKDIILGPGLFGLEFVDADHLVWYSLEDEPTNNGNERKKLVQARSTSIETQARPILAAVQNSDAHTIADFVAQHSNRCLTRVKMNELSFEGLRMAFTDPGARVRAAAKVPPAFPRVLGMQMNGGFLDNNTLHLSDNLNCFIGGRGTGKSTAVKSLAYGLGLEDEFEDQENCPDSTVIYCEDANGVRYRYERIRGQLPDVLAKEDQSIRDVPADSFRVEFYGQGELADVAKDPLGNAALLQEFLDRHIILGDLISKEADLIQELSQNSAQLVPIEATTSQIPGKRVRLNQIDTKLKIAETGKVKEIAAYQTKLAAEKSLNKSLEAVEKKYRLGVTLKRLQTDYDELAQTAGTLTGQKNCNQYFDQAKTAIDLANQFLDRSAREINQELKTVAQQLRIAIDGLNAAHRSLEQQLRIKIVELQTQGLSVSVRELNELIAQRSSLAAEIGQAVAQLPLLKELGERRSELLRTLLEVRTGILERRKRQLKTINDSLLATIQDFTIFLYYDDSGIIKEFESFIEERMHGTYFQDEMARSLCAGVSPIQLAELIREKKIADLATLQGIGSTWANPIIERLCNLRDLHALEVISKPAKPVIKVLTKGAKPREISVNQLSDGQKHTILLTIAMLAESNIPLIMDQPEDDLDNTFIFKTVVTTLRKIKETRQVIVVTHNANIAVLGDSELLLPMQRSGDTGRVSDRGSVDRTETKKAVQDILEGGELAFRKRKEIYGY